MNLIPQYKQKAIKCRRLETESDFAEIAFQFPPLGAGTDKLKFHFYKLRTECKGDTTRWEVLTKG